MPDSYSAAQSSLSFAKLVATPTEKSWSQAYNAGNLFVCLALTAEETPEESLQSVGKELFTTLQSEFFILEQKDTEHIKQAIHTSVEKLPETIKASLILAFFKENTLYVFIAGGGKIVMKRHEKVGVLLEKHAASAAHPTAASGFLQNGDTLVLQTGPFAQEVSHESVTAALDLALPTDIVEALSPQIHAQENGAMAAIIITYKGASHKETMLTEEVATEKPEKIEEPEEETIGDVYESDNLAVPEQPMREEPEEDELPEPEQEHKPKKSLSLPPLPKLPDLKFHLNHRRKLFLSIACIIFLLLIVSIFFTVKRQADNQQKALFQSIYPQALQYYQTGQGLTTLNPTQSQDDYHKAESLLKDGKTKINKGSDYYKQMDDLLAKVESALSTDTTAQATPTKEMQPEKNSLLDVAAQNKQGLAFGEDTTSVYMITGSAVSTISKTSGTKKDIIKNTNYWSSPQAVVPYGGNIYVLDQKNGVMKFVAGSGGYGKSTYFKGQAPDLSQASGMAIDGSVWLMLKDGTLLQYTKGISNGIKTSGLPTPLQNPTKLVTDITMEHVYVLDQGNSRIVQFDKHGAYQKAYVSPVVGRAAAFTVSEKERTIHVLSDGKVWQMDL